MARRQLSTRLRRETRPQRLRRRGRDAIEEVETRVRSRIDGRELAFAALIMGTTIIARKAAQEGWRRSTGDEPPPERPDEDFDLREAVTWSLASGALVAGARLFVTWAMSRR